MPVDRGRLAFKLRKAAAILPEREPLDRHLGARYDKKPPDDWDEFLVVRGCTPKKQLPLIDRPQILAAF
jgi:hypothetical protein